MLYHETTYLKDLEDRATKRFHCTTVQAAYHSKKRRGKTTAYRSLQFQV